MRKYYKNDLIKQAKDLSLSSVYDIYFLLQDNEVVFVGRNIQNSGGIQGHLKDKKFNRYFAQFVETEGNAIALEREYIDTFKPLYNNVGAVKNVLIEKPKIETKEVVQKVTKVETSGLITIELSRYPQNIDLPIGEYKASDRNGFNRYFFNINGKIYWAKVGNYIYSYEGTLYRPTTLKGMIKDIIFVP